MQEDINSPSPHKGDHVESEQVIDASEYMALMQRVQALRTQVQARPRPEAFDPWSFFAVFDRVYLKPGYVPDFIFTPIEVLFGPGAWSELSRGAFTLTTRRVIWPARERGLVGQLIAHLLPQKATRARVICTNQHMVSSSERLGLRLRLQQGLEGLVFERSASGFLQFAVFSLEADR